MVNKKKYGLIFAIIILIMFLLTACAHTQKEPQDVDDIERKVTSSQDYILAVQYFDAQNYDKALVCYQKVLDMLENERQAESSAGYWIKGQIARCYVLEKEYEKALPYMQEAKEGFEKRGDNYQLFTIYHEEGQYYAAIGQDNKALECYKKAIEYAEGEQLIYVYTSMALSYDVLHEEQEELKYYNLAIEEGERQNNRESLVNVYYSKGAYLTQNNQIEEAKQHIEKGMEYAEYIWGKNDIKVAEGYRRLFQVNFREGDYESAYTYCRKAMDIYKNQSEIYSYEGDMASLYNNMGVLNKKLGDYAAALEMYRKSYDIVKDRMGEQDFLAFYEEILSKNIKSFYDSTVDDERGYEAWFEENFENRSGQ